MANLHRTQQGLQYLLELDGEFFPMENGFWAMIEAHLVKPREHTPHGIKYSLTLHDAHNRRVLGYDNAHIIRIGGRNCPTTRKVWDHRHHRNRVEPYEFQSAQQLMQDFWRDACRVIAESARKR